MGTSASVITTTLNFSLFHSSKQMASVCVAGVRAGPLGMVMTVIATTMTATLTADVRVKGSGI